MENTLKYYQGTIPCCGVFCGGCPNYVCDKSKCRGATTHCEQRKCEIYKCCVEKKVLRFCFECKTFPCRGFKKFAETWLKYGQDLIRNQHLLKETGDVDFANHYNSKNQLNDTI